MHEALSSLPSKEEEEEEGGRQAGNEGKKGEGEGKRGKEKGRGLWFKVYTALAKNPSQDRSTHIRQLLTTCNCSFRGSKAFSGHLHSRHRCPRAYMKLFFLLSFKK